MNPNILIMVSIILYLAGVVYVGFKFSHETQNADGFYLGGRKLGPLVTAMSAEASDMSSWLLMGLPGVAYSMGICDPGWTAFGLALGTYLNWLLVAKRLRIYTYRLKAFTIPGYFSKRFHDEKKVLLGISALVIAVFFVPYTGSGFAACGKLFATLFNADYHMAMIISAIVILVYTTLGGFLAASTTDFIQSIVMTIALVVVLAFGITSAGGFANVIDNAKSLPGYFDISHVYDAASNSAKPYGIITTISIISWGLGYFGMPHILLRFMAIEDKEKLKISRRVASIWVVIAMAVAVLIGVVGNAMSANGAMDVLKDPETIIVKISVIISENGAFFAIIAGVILAGILASTMSTADSQLLAASSSVSEDIIKGVFKIKISDKTTLILARVTLVVIGIIGIIIAWDPNSSVFNIVSFAWAGFGAAFAPVVLFSLFWKRVNKYGAIAGMLSGGIMVYVWEYIIGPMNSNLAAIYELLPAFIVSCIFIVVVSLVTPEPSKEIYDEFDSYKAKINTK